MATNIADLFAQATRTQMPNVYYIAPPDARQVATYGNPFDRSKYDTGTGRNTIPSWMQNDPSGVNGHDGIGSIGPLPHVVLPGTHPKPRLPEPVPLSYDQAVTVDPFLGQGGGASGAGNSVELPVSEPTEWQAPRFRDNVEDGKNAKDKRTEKRDGQAKDGRSIPQWWGDQSDGGFLKDTASVVSQTVAPLLTRRVIGTGGAAIGGLVNPMYGPIIGGTVADQAVGKPAADAVDRFIENLFGAENRIDDNVVVGQEGIYPAGSNPFAGEQVGDVGKPDNNEVPPPPDKQPEPQPEPKKDDFNSDNIVWQTTPNEAPSELNAPSPDSPIGNTSGQEGGGMVYVPDDWDNMPAIFTEPFNTDTGAFGTDTTGMTASELADLIMPMSDLGSIGFGDDSTLTTADREAWEAYILGMQNKG